MTPKKTDGSCMVAPACHPSMREAGGIAMSEIPGWAGLCSEFSTSLEDKSPETLSQQTEEKRGVGKTEKGDIFFFSGWIMFRYSRG